MSDAAFEQIVVSQRPALLRLAARVLGRRADMAEDVVQEALWRAHRALRAGERVDELRLRAWLHSIVRHACIDELRRGRPELVDDGDAVEAAPARDDAAAPVLRREALRDVLAGVAALPPRQRLVLEETVLGGVSRVELGARLGTTEGASKVLLNRARASLRAAAAAA